MLDTIKLEAFRALLECEQLQRLVIDGVNCEANRINCKVTTKIGRKYTNVDIGSSGRYMVVNDTGEIFGIKGYGTIHRGHAFGTLDTIQDWNWGGYRAVRVPVPTANLHALPELSQSVPTITAVTPYDRRQCNNRGLTQAYELRDLAANMAIALKDELTQPDGKLAIKRDEFGKPIDAQAVSQLIRAWSEAREAIRILRGRPLPGSLRPERKPAAKRKPDPITRIATEQSPSPSPATPLPVEPVSPTITPQK